MGTISSHSLEKDIASGNGLGLTQGRMIPQKVSWFFECLETLQGAHQLAES